MHSRTRLWLPLIIILFVGTFLVGFQPIRTPPKEVVPDSSFTFQFDKPLAQTKAEYAAKAQEVQAGLMANGFSKEDVESVEVTANDRVQVKTYALNADQVTQDEKNLLQALQKKYQGVKAVARAAQQQEQEQPIASIGSLALYRPSPKVKLGLDLQGGLHVVLRCLPYASMTFTTADETQQPLYAVPPPTPEAGKPAEAKPAAPAGAATVSRDELEKRIESGWRVGLTYDYTLARSGSQDIHFLGLQAILNLTGNWRLSYTTSLDMVGGDFVRQTFSIYRDLRSWEARLRLEESRGVITIWFLVDIKDIPDIRVEGRPSIY